MLWLLIVETEEYSQDESAYHGYRRRSPQNETLYSEPITNFKPRSVDSLDFFQQPSSAM